jgi:trans-aconitate methyltransferase
MISQPDSSYGGDLAVQRPNAARMYEHYLGGSLTFAADRRAARAVTVAAPQVVAAARANRAFVYRVVRYALRQGVGQFLDLGCGLPTPVPVDHLTAAIRPTARVLYVDVDPVVVAHTATRLAGRPHTGVLHADIRDIDRVLDHPTTTALLDPTQPTGVLLTAVAHYLPGDLSTLTATLLHRLHPGSLLALTHPTTPHPTPPPANHPAWRAAAAVYASTATPIQLRTPAQIRALLAGYHLVPPTTTDPTTTGPTGTDPTGTDPTGTDPTGGPAGGLVPVTGWRRAPDQDSDVTGAAAPAVAWLLAAVARTPPRSPPRPPPPAPRRVLGVFRGGRGPGADPPAAPGDQPGGRVRNAACRTCR